MSVIFGHLGAAEQENAQQSHPLILFIANLLTHTCLLIHPGPFQHHQN